MRIALFLLDTLFFFLVASALLRAWMNSSRLRMTQQPGLFVMALTVLLTGGVFLMLYRTRWGLHVRATVQNRDLAETSGIRTRTRTRI